ncbi:MAG: aminoglycoside phosphotransferase [marine bacterium B5-7]|nr:MAG: aminoglycoside phosphotransferase [marine bacterium B5-7]
MTPDDAVRIADWLKFRSAASSVTITDSRSLSGGAIQDNRAMQVHFDGGELDGDHALVLRMSNPGMLSASHSKAEEFALLKAAFAAGVSVPQPLYLCEDTTVLGQPFFVMQKIDGIAIGAKIVRDASIGGGHASLLRRLALELVRIHHIGTDQTDSDDGLDLKFLGPRPLEPATELIEQYQSWLDQLAEPHPVLEWGLRWLRLNVPTAPATVLCHRDFRTGNYLVDAKTVTGILDWEFAGWGDPAEDVGWLCCRSWRFGADQKEAGGIGSRKDFVTAYLEAGGYPMDDARINYYEVMANIRWAIIALKQTGRVTSGAESSLELALIGRRVPEMEFEILRLTGG